MNRVARIAVALMVLGLSAVRAVSIPLELGGEEDLARVILSARDRVLVLAPTLRNRVVANALRQVAVEGRVRVAILADAGQVGLPSSFIPALSYLRERGHPVEVRLLRGVTGSSLVADDHQVVHGPLVAERAGFGLEPTRLSLDPADARRQSAYFASQWKRATPWSYRVNNPKFSTRKGRNQ